MKGRIITLDSLILKDRLLLWNAKFITHGGKCFGISLSYVMQEVYQSIAQCWCPLLSGKCTEMKISPQKVAITMTIKYNTGFKDKDQHVQDVIQGTNLQSSPSNSQKPRTIKSTKGKVSWLDRSEIHAILQFLMHQLEVETFFLMRLSRILHYVTSHQLITYCSLIQQPICLLFELWQLVNVTGHEGGEGKTPMSMGTLPLNESMYTWMQWYTQLFSMSYILANSSWGQPTHLSLPQILLPSDSANCHTCVMSPNS